MSLNPENPDSESLLEYLAFVKRKKYVICTKTILQKKQNLNYQEVKMPQYSIHFSNNLCLEF